MRAFVYFLSVLHYLLVLPDHRVAALTLGPGTLDRPLHHYKILSSAQHGKDQWLYVREGKTESVIIYYQSPDKHELDLFDTTTHLYTHWYLETALKAYTHYPAITTADSATFAALAGVYQAAMLAAADSSHISLADLYASATGQDQLTKILIDHHLNPFTSLDEFSARAQQLNVHLPQLPIHHSASRRPSIKGS